MLFQNFDISVLNWIHNSLSCALLDFIMPKISLMGNYGAIFLLTSFILMGTKKYRRYGFILIISLACDFIICNMLLKPIIARPRPCWIYKNAELLISNPSDYSFPSGHTIAAVSSAVVLTLTNKKFCIYAVVFAILTAFSRLYLFVHYPSDILGGALLGYIIGYFSFYLFKNAFDNKYLKAKISH